MTTPQNPPPLRFTLERVIDARVLTEEWHPLLTTIFTNPADLEPLDVLLARLRDPARNAFSLLRREDGRPCGLHLIQMDPGIPGAAYIPWGGVANDLRNVGLYPDMDTQALRFSGGIAYSLTDFENPARIHAVYGDEPGGEPARRAEGRLNFFRREMNARIVDDPAVPYLRPASNDTQKVQDCALLSVNYLGAEDPTVFNADKSAMKKDAYRRFYLEITRLQYGDRDERDLRAAYPAADLFLETLDRHPTQWIALRAGALKPRSKAAVPAVITRVKD